MPSYALSIYETAKYLFTEMQIKRNKFVNKTAFLVYPLDKDGKNAIMKEKTRGHKYGKVL